MRCVNTGCAKLTWVLEDHRIAATHCLLTTRAAKWATVQVGTGRTVSEVSAELACDWHRVNDAVTTYCEALLAADRKRLNKTSAIGLDETSFVRLGPKRHTNYATTVADVENHQIIDILPTRHVGHLRRRLLGHLARRAPGGRSFPPHCPGQPLLSHAVRRRVQAEQTGHRGRRNDPLCARRVLLMGKERLDVAGTERLWSQ